MPGPALSAFDVFLTTAPQRSTESWRNLLKPHCSEMEELGFQPRPLEAAPAWPCQAAGGEPEGRLWNAPAQLLCMSGA